MAVSPYGDWMEDEQSLVRTPDDWFVMNAPSPDATSASRRSLGESVIADQGIGADPSSVQAFAEGRMSEEEFRALQQRRASSNGQGGANSAVPSAPMGQSGGPQSIQPYTRPFQAPTMEQATASPGFQFRLGEGIKALQRSAAARGTLLTGGTLKDLTKFAEDSASAEYDKVYGRAVGEYGLDRENFLTNEGNRFSSQRTNRLDDFSIMDTDRRFGLDASKFDWSKGQDLWGRKNLEDDQFYQRAFRVADYGYWAARG